MRRTVSIPERASRPRPRNPEATSRSPSLSLHRARHRAALATSLLVSMSGLALAAPAPEPAAPPKAGTAAASAPKPAAPPKAGTATAPAPKAGAAAAPAPKAAEPPKAGTAAAVAPKPAAPPKAGAAAAPAPAATEPPQDHPAAQPGPEEAPTPRDEQAAPAANAPDRALVPEEPSQLTAGSARPAGAARPASSPHAGEPPRGGAATRGASAAGAAPGGSPTDAEDSDEPKTPLAPPARDTVGKHIAVGAVAGLIVPLGSVASGTAQSDTLSSGLVLAGDITYGVSRTVMLGAYGEVGMPSGRGAWAGQTASSIAAGPMLRYHLVQGVRFDPWLSAGIGFRRTSSGNDSVTGIDWTRLQIGGDWYATSQLGFGPVLELALGTFLDSTASNLGAKSVNAHFILGGRIVFDGPGK
jgi:hypothetical protein